MRTRQALFAIVVAGAAVAPASVANAGVPERAADPIVLDGGEVSSLLGSDPDSVVAYRYEAGWKRVPVQVDERKLVDYAAVRQNHQTADRPFSLLAYADPGTFAGADPNLALDADDEIVAMARDAGPRKPVDASDPAGVIEGTRVELAVTDTLAPDDGERYLYLFRDAAPYAPAAEDYVSYDFNLDSGDYKSTYDFSGLPDGDAGNPDPSGSPANPESSTVTTGHYRQELLSRWITTGIAVDAGASTGSDILDGDKTQVSYACGRTEFTFSRGGGGFIANIDGPVRAIRSYIGANSGTYTQRDHIYYDRAAVTNTYLRVHPGISRITQFLDYSSAANGMTYRTSAAPAGVSVNGLPDPALETGTSLGPQLAWEQLTGPQGTLTIVNRLTTTMPGVAVGSYYQDDLTPSVAQCGGYGDLQAWGASGSAIDNSGKNTDPTLNVNDGGPYILTGARTIYFSGPGGDAALAKRRSDEVDAPVGTTVAAAPEFELRLKAPDSKRVRNNKPVRFLVRVANDSDAPIREVRLCGRGKGIRVSDCRLAAGLDAGDTAKLRLEVELRNPRRGSRTLRLSAAVEGFERVRDTVELEPRN